MNMSPISSAGCSPKIIFDRVAASHHYFFNTGSAQNYLQYADLATDMLTHPPTGPTPRGRDRVGFVALAERRGRSCRTVGSLTRGPRHRVAADGPSRSGRPQGPTTPLEALRAEICAVSENGTRWRDPGGTVSNKRTTRTPLRTADFARGSEPPIHGPTTFFAAICPT